MPWDNVIGHDEICARLRGAIEADRVTSAYLFVGPEGVGKRTVMQAFAGALLCSSGGAISCGECKSCKLFESGNHPDMVALEPKKENISVDEMREFCRQVILRPMEGKRRVCTVPDAGKMTEAAANCFLKTLEEPPPTATLFLRGEATDRMLRTIVSRCQIVRLPPLENDLVARTLKEREGLDTALAQTLALLSEGSLGAALNISTGEAAEDWRWLEENLTSLRPADALPFSDELTRRAGREGGGGQMRQGSQKILSLMALHLRQQLRQGGPARQLLDHLEAVWQASERLDHNVTPDLVLRSLALKLADRQ